MKPVQERFFAKVNKDGSTGCWLWVAFIVPSGYGRLRIGEKNVFAHRVSYELFIGPIPAGAQVDHRCGCRTCVNPDHLRLATHAENMRNQKTPKNNTSGFKGVSWNKQKKKWRAGIRANGKTVNLGDYATPEAAYAAYCEAAKQFHGEFANLGTHSTTYQPIPAAS